MTHQRRAPRYQSLDILRFLAFSLVVLYHSNVPGFENGWIGVDIFFVISGFVVTKSALALISESDSQISSSPAFTFIKRRFTRLFPALFVMLSIVLPWSYLLSLPSGRDVRLGEAISASLGINNLYQLREGADYFNQGDGLSPFIHLWSLGVEEQFYALYAFFLFTLTSKRWRALRKRRCQTELPLSADGSPAPRQRGGIKVAWLLGVAYVVLGFLSFFIAFAELRPSSWPIDVLYLSPLHRMWQLMCGVILAVNFRPEGIEVAPFSQENSLKRSFRKPSYIWGTFAVTLILVALFSSYDRWQTPALLTTIGMLFLIKATVREPSVLISRNRENQGGQKLIQYLGKVSKETPIIFRFRYFLQECGKRTYGAYLWHLPIIWTLNEVLILPPAVVAFVCFFFSMILGDVSFRYLEKSEHHIPSRLQKSSNRSVDRPLRLLSPVLLWSAAGFVFVLFALAVAGHKVPLVQSNSRVPDALGVAALSEDQSMFSGVGAKPVTSNPPNETLAEEPAPLIIESAGSASNRVPIGDDDGFVDPISTPNRPCFNEIVSSGCWYLESPGDDSPRIFIFGDSHVDDLLPGINLVAAEEANITVGAAVFGGCPWQLGLAYERFDNDRCESFQKKFYEEVLPTLHADVILVGHHASSEWGFTLQDRSSGEALSIASDEWQEITRRSIRLLRETGARVKVLEPRSNAPFNVPDCLSLAFFYDECEFERSESVDNEGIILKALSIRESTFETISINDLLCNTDNCFSIYEGIRTRYDSNHLDPAFAQSISEKIIERILS